MKIVTYNVNGLRQRVSQHGSLLRLLTSLDADIICFQIRGGGSWLPPLATAAGSGEDSMRKKETQSWRIVG
ncbi:hypothetical protein Cni_G14007 [Canna indica]|uniref:Uncharacterized protein n=1 Tax=Canna indica TaxID=4628 RepID=A0AAQ3QEA9_9LILI|nr:hypothetical protein Cni_G14007 [Canna indica]